MVANDTIRDIEEAIKNDHNIEATERNITTETATSLQDKSHLQTSTVENHENTGKDDTKQSCYYKPLSSPMLRHRKQKVSMFEVQPSAVTEITQVQELCIEAGVEQYVKKSVPFLPELSSSHLSSEQGELPTTELHTSCSLSTISDNKPETNVRQMTENPIDFQGTSHSQDLRKIVAGKDNGWMNLGSKLGTPRNPSYPATPPVSPSLRRRSVGVLTTPAWALRTYRDPDRVESRTSPSQRRRSLVLPARHAQDWRTQSPLRRSLVSPNVTELTTRKDCLHCNQLSNSAEELLKSNKDFPLKDQEQQLDYGNENESQDKSQADIEHISDKKTDAILDDELGDFRPRLRSRSLDEYRTEAREKVLQNRHRLCLHEPDKRRESRRKSFEVWLTDKEQETIKKLQMLSLEKQRASEDEARKKEQRKGKTYKEWLNDKNNMVAVKDDSSEKQDETTKVVGRERQQIAQRRYNKWLMEKERQSLEKEREMLKQAKLKTIEMRKKYEEKKRNKLKFLTGSLFS